MVFTLFSLIIAAFIVGAIWITGRAASNWKKISSDHLFRMAQLRFTEDENIHRRYLEAAESDRIPSDLELDTRKAEAIAKAARAETNLTNAKIAERRRNHY